jgi:hypothetical protein
VGGKGGGRGRGEKWPKPCMHIWIIIKKKRRDEQRKYTDAYCSKIVWNLGHF